MNISVNAVNDAPVVVGDIASTPINVAISNIAVLANDSDIDGDPLSVLSATVNPALGTVTVNADNTLSFTPALNASGPIVITYTVSDGQGGSTSGTLTVNVGANTAPNSANASRVTLEDTPVTLATADFAFTDPDAAQGLANVRIDTLPASGSLLLNAVAVTTGQVISAADIAAGRLVFAPALNGNGAPYASFTFSVQDSAGAFDSAPNSVTLNVTPVNDAPLAVNDTVASTAEDTPAVISQASLLVNDSDVDADTLTIASVQGAVGGTVSLSGANVVFTPTPNYNGPASFTYTIIDGNGGTSTATVNVAVTPKESTAPPVNPYIEAPTFYVLPPIITTDPALHVLYSVNDVRVDTGLRIGLGIFQTDSATLAELSSEQALLIDTLTAPRGFEGLDDSHLRGNGIGTVNALFVQHAVRHEALVSEAGLFVQNSVRSSQFESLARNIRVDSFNSAIPGVGTLLDPFAIGSPSATPAGEAANSDRQAIPTLSIEKPTDVPTAKEMQVAKPGEIDKTSNDSSDRQVKRRAADGFATQLRQNAATFRTSAVRPETPLKETTRVTR